MICPPWKIDFFPGDPTGAGKVAFISHLQGELSVKILSRSAAVRKSSERVILLVSGGEKLREQL